MWLWLFIPSQKCWRGYYSNAAIPRWLGEWVRESIRWALPCRHNTDYSFSLITVKLHMKVVDDEKRNPIDFGSQYQRLRSTQGCPTFFPLEHDWTLLEHKGLKPKASLRRGGVTPSRRWGPGGFPREIFWKIASKWCILVYFRAVIANFKTENLYEKIFFSLRKDFTIRTIK